MKKLLKTMLVLAGASAGLAIAQVVITVVQEHYGRFGGSYDWWIQPAFYGICIVVGGILTMIFSEKLLSSIMAFLRKVEKGITQASYKTVLFSCCGLGFGLLIAFLISTIILHLGNTPLTVCINVMLYIVCIYLGLVVAKKMSHAKGRTGFYPEESTVQSDQKYVDTSVIIDGRIFDICKTGVLEGTLIIPEFVLAELQHIADSEDALRRAKGRRGLDILQKMQNELGETGLHVEVRHLEKAEEEPVDAALLRLAKEVGGKVLTLDYNLNKVAAVQKVSVININELANAIKPLLLPGEELNVCILKKGREREQGIAYLEDGTMIVVEEAKNRVGEEFRVAVTSVLQTAAGRMIFAKPLGK